MAKLRETAEGWLEMVWGAGLLFLYLSPLYHSGIASNWSPAGCLEFHPWTYTSIGLFLSATALAIGRTNTAFRSSALAQFMVITAGILFAASIDAVLGAKSVHHTCSSYSCETLWFSPGLLVLWMAAMARGVWLGAALLLLGFFILASDAMEAVWVLESHWTATFGRVPP